MWGDRKIVGVNAIIGADLVLASKLAFIAADSTPLGPGLSGAEANQLAIQWAVRRDLILRTQPSSAAVYARDGGAFLGRYPVSDAGLQVIPGQVPMGKILSPFDDAEVSAVPIFGDTPIDSGDRPDVPGLPEGWAAKLALALDAQIRGLGELDTSDTPPAVVTPGIFPAGAVIYVLITGAAAVVVTSAAVAWRLFDPEYRTQAAAIDAASLAYASRLGVFEATGQMPAASAIEIASADAVVTAAEDDTSRGYLVGAAVTGGIAAGTLLAGALRR